MNNKKLIAILNKKIKKSKKWIKRFDDIEYAHQDGTVEFVKETISMMKSLAEKFNGKPIVEKPKKVKKSNKSKKAKTEVNDHGTIVPLEQVATISETSVSEPVKIVIKKPAEKKIPVRKSSQPKKTK